MSDKFTIPEGTDSQQQLTSHFTQDLPGKITQLIGSGKHAQAAIVWQTIKWSFIAGSVFSIWFLIYASLCGDKKSPTEDIRTIWSIFIPVITLALGYIFGKGKE